MINELTKVGETFNTEYSMYVTDILIIVPAAGMDHNASKPIQVKKLQAAQERCRETALKSPSNFNAR